MKKINIGGKLITIDKSLYQIFLTFFGLNKSSNKFLTGIAGLNLKTRTLKLPDNYLLFINNSLRLNFIILKILYKKYSVIIKKEKQLGSYRGLRLKLGLPNRGQRTHSNAKTMKNRRNPLI